MKRYLLTLSFLIAISTMSSAQTLGPYGPGKFSFMPLAGSSKSWSNIINISASDNAYATFGNLSNTVGAYTDYIIATNFSFNLPARARITGITALVERSDPNGMTADYSIRIIKNGVVGSSEHSKGMPYPVADASNSYGGTQDLWDETWTPADINSQSFGIAVAAQRSVKNGTTAGRIDNIVLIVTYDFLTTLPVDLVDFRADRKDKSVVISWTTANEENMSYYDVERSVDGSSFTAIDRVNSQNISYNVTRTFNDEKAGENKLWYRLKMVETSGSVKYSSVVSIASTGSLNSHSLYPNPLTANTSLQVNNSANEKLTISFYNQSGNRIAETSTSSSVVSLDEHVKATTGILYYRINDAKGMVKATGNLLLMK